jgi:hypothetical protein
MFAAGKKYRRVMPDLEYQPHAVSRLLPVLICGAVLAAAVGCGSSNTGGGSSVTAAESSVSAVDVCALLSAEDVSALLGATVDGAPSDSRCVWENPDNLESVSVEIGSPGTAGSGTLRPPEPGLEGMYTPGPDGMRFTADGAVEFVAGGRANSVQVAVLGMIGDGTANDAAVDLARKIAPRVPE